MPDVCDPVTPDSEQQTEQHEGSLDLLHDLAWMLYQRGVLSETDCIRFIDWPSNHWET
jgi:hypothetical protein